MEENFIDWVKIHGQAGKGGDGSVHFRREKYVPKGGPDGGDGGRGGHIGLRSTKQGTTLLHLKYQKHIRAKSGQAGAKQQRHGANGKDVWVDVPLGTVVKDCASEKTLAELTEEKEMVLLKGGAGGKGNAHFKSSTQQSPHFATQGQAGEEAWISLEVKLLADIGLVGHPNAGKSTLLATLSAARPKIAAYPFTTLQPALGVVGLQGFRSFVMADIPGLIQGAAKGKGLGIRFLRHIERTHILAFVIPCTSADVQAEYEGLCKELQAYDAALMDKKRLLIISKCDLLPKETSPTVLSDTSIPHHHISAITQQGTEALKEQLWKMLQT